MDKALMWMTKALVGTAAAAALIGVSAEVLARWEGAGPLPITGRMVPVKFHAVTVYVSPVEAMTYHVAVAVFVVAILLGLLVRGAAKAGMSGGNRRQ